MTKNIKNSLEIKKLIINAKKSLENLYSGILEPNKSFKNETLIYRI
jgi:hypothetical protein